jgi:hypothetical protein
VDATIAEMQRRFESLAASCDHKAVFALAYLRTTQTYEWARDQPGYFLDTRWVDQEDSVFADFYFQAFDDRARGGGIPPAWKIAFDAAARREVTGLGDALLGMNAHINRDLPFALAAVGLAGADGSSRKPDHDKVDQFLAGVIGPLLDEIAARFDPTATAYGPAGTAAALSLLATWRELSWHNAELLAGAHAGPGQDIVAQLIETSSAAEAESLVAGSSYLPLLQSSSARDNYCADHHGDRPPTPYPFGAAGPDRRP